MSGERSEYCATCGGYHPLTTGGCNGKYFIKPVAVVTTQTRTGNEYIGDGVLAAAPERDKESGEQVKLPIEEQLWSLAMRVYHGNGNNHDFCEQATKLLEADHLSALSTLQERVEKLEADKSREKVKS